MSYLLLALLGAQAHADTLDAPEPAPPKVIEVRPASTAPAAGCEARLQVPAGVAALALADGERQADGRFLCSWLVTASGAEFLELGVQNRGTGAHDSLRVVRADGIEVTRIDAVLTPEPAVLSVPATMVLELRVRHLDRPDGVTTRIHAD